MHSYRTAELNHGIMPVKLTCRPAKDPQVNEKYNLLLVGYLLLKLKLL
jgi:hypothetical protein